MSSSQQFPLNRNKLEKLKELIFNFILTFYVAKFQFVQHFFSNLKCSPEDPLDVALGTARRRQPAKVDP